MTMPRFSPDDDTIRAIADAVAARRPATREKWVDRLIVWAVAVLLAWGTLQTDVAVLKSRVDNQDALLQEMRTDIKTLLLRTR
jgi:hypothetical protein